MAGFVDLYVVPVPKKNLPLYRRAAQKMGRIMRGHGCLEFREFLGDDLHVKNVVSPLTMVRLEKGEVLVFSVTGFRSRAHRDRVLKRTMKDPRVKKLGSTLMPFDCRRMVYGGFKTIVKA